MLGREKDASKLVRGALKRNRKAFDHCYQEFAWQAFVQGVSMLQGGEPRSAILKRWKAALETYGQSRYREQLEDLVGQLTRQVADESKPHAVADPAKLPVDERIAYHMARLQDTNGYQWSKPGRWQTLGLGDKSSDADASHATTCTAQTMPTCQSWGRKNTPTARPRM